MEYASTGLERARLYEISNKSSSDYKRVDLMYKLYRVCSGLKIPNADRIYSLYLSRLQKRIRLEASLDNLEVIVAVLYYIDECQTHVNYDIRDILSRLTVSNINLKKFVRLISKICAELNITSLPIQDDSLLLLNILDQLRQYCRQYLIDELDVLIPKSTTTVLCNINQYIELDKLLDDPSQYNTIEDSKDISPTSNISNINYSVIYKLLGIKFDHIETTVLNILPFVDNKNNRNVLDSKSRKLFSCRKTLFAAITYIVTLSLKIPITPTVFINALKIPRSSFYRKYNNLLRKIASVLVNKFKCKINDLSSTTTLIPIFYNKLHNTDSSESNTTERPTSGSLDNIKRSKTLAESGKSIISNADMFDENIKIRDIRKLRDTHQIENIDPFSSPELIKVISGFGENSSNTSSMYAKSIECLRILDELDDRETQRNGTYIIHERTKNRIICRWNDGKVTRRKCFSINRYGYELAYKLAQMYSKLK